MLKKNLIGTFHRLGSSLVTSDSIMIGYERDIFERLSHSHESTEQGSALYDYIITMGSETLCPLSRSVPIFV